jgi:hypothetical protein
MTIPARGSDVVTWTFILRGGPPKAKRENRGQPSAALYYRKTIDNQVHQWRQAEVKELEREVVFDYQGVVA